MDENNVTKSIIIFYASEERCAMKKFAMMFLVFVMILTLTIPVMAAPANKGQYTNELYAAAHYFNNSTQERLLVHIYTDYYHPAQFLMTIETYNASGSIVESFSEYVSAELVQANLKKGLISINSGDGEFDFVMTFNTGDLIKETVTFYNVDDTFINVFFKSVRVTRLSFDNKMISLKGVVFGDSYDIVYDYTQDARTDYSGVYSLTSRSAMLVFD